MIRLLVGCEERCMRYLQHKAFTFVECFHLQCEKLFVIHHGAKQTSKAVITIRTRFHVVCILWAVPEKHDDCLNFSTTPNACDVRDFSCAKQLFINQRKNCFFMKIPWKLCERTAERNFLRWIKAHTGNNAGENGFCLRVIYGFNFSQTAEK